MKENRYDNKRLLLIAPLFFGYYKEIVKEAENMGLEVDYVCDAPSNSNISKAIGRINKNFIKNMSVKYFDNDVYPRISAKTYDYVLVVAGMTFAFFPDMLEKIKECQKKAKFIMYQWDSEKNLPYSTGIHHFFDSIYTFDRIDFQNNKKYKFLPLFYTGMYEEIGSCGSSEIEYDCSYIGTAHPRKYKEINAMAAMVKNKFPRQYIYHYMPSILKYVFHKVTAPEYKKAKLCEFQRKKLQGNELLDIFKKSYCVLDAPQKGQVGLTIRTIECIGAKKKIITTNLDVVNYDFYNKNNILVFNGEIDENDVFFLEDYTELPAEVYKKYSLRSWLDEILSSAMVEVII